MIAADTTFRVRYAETDTMGVVYYANYFVWFEVARCEALRQAGHSYRELEAGGLMLPVIDASCQYFQPGRYDDELVVSAQGRLLSPVRVEFTYDLVRNVDQVKLATGRTVHAATHPNGRPRRLPDSLRELLA